MADETTENDQHAEDDPDSETTPAGSESPPVDDADVAGAATGTVSESAAAAEPEPVTPAEPETVVASDEPEPVTPAEPETVAASDEPDDEVAPDDGPPASVDEPGVQDHEPLLRGAIDMFGVAMGTGRRKTAVARVRVKPGSGLISINGRELEDYFSTERDRNMVVAPLKATQKLDSVDVWVRVNGGGTTGQTGAVVLGIARALQALDPGQHQTLAESGFMTRDGRMVERKKYGLRKARRSYQFSKR